MRINPTVLIIDDDKFFLEFYKAELAQHNMRVEFATDGESGVSQAIKTKPDAIFLDIILPNKDGFQVLKELKENDETNNIPVMIVSALESESDKKKLMSLGAAEIFNKIKQLPRDIVIRASEIIESSDIGTKSPIIKDPEIIKKHVGTSLSSTQVSSVFKASLDQIEGSLEKLFVKKPSLEDMNVSVISSGTLQEHILELSKIPGTIFIFSKIKAKAPVLAILSMKRDDTLALIKLIEKGTGGKNLALEMGDQVIGEFFNIIINGFLTHLAKSVSDILLLQAPKVADAESMMRFVKDMEIPNENLVVFLEEAYSIEVLNLSFSLFMTFSGNLFQGSND